ncbi:MAG TPA: leucyl aminopeptidase [Acidimicrobiales bacterium]|nr:leucyl aminopeptidase [Acidimicrobiales bacterium]
MTTREQPPIDVAPALSDLAVAGRLPAGVDVVGVPVGTNMVVPRGAPDVDREWLTSRGFTGAAGEVAVVAGSPTVVVVGTVAPGRDPEAARRAAATFVRNAGRDTHAAFLVRPLVGRGGDPAAVVRAAAEGAGLASYRYRGWKSATPTPRAPARVTLVGVADATSRRAADSGVAVAGAVALARNLVNEPPVGLTPRRFAAVAEQVAERHGLELTVLDEDAIEAEGLGALAGVARGSAEPARLVRLRHRRPGAARLALVGKGITFDSGGLSLKTTDGMSTMKNDMTGAAVVLAAVAAAAQLGVEADVEAFMPLTENMPGGRALKVSDVIRARNGKTIEVMNTDAEGRLVLADALSLAAESRPDAMVDVATLTGAVTVALGRRIAGLMGNDDRLLASLEDAGAAAGERLWRLPLPDDYRRDLDSEVADMKNVGLPNRAGSIIAGLFLQEFVDGRPWAHLDIAGVAHSDAEEHYLSKGGTAFGVRTLVALAESFAG